MYTNMCQPHCVVTPLPPGFGFGARCLSDLLLQRFKSFCMVFFTYLFTFFFFFFGGGEGAF